MVKDRTEILIETPDRIVMNAFATVNGKEVKMKEIATVRAK